MGNSIPGDNSKGILYAIFIVLLTAIIVFGNRGFLGLSKMASYSIFIGVIVFIVLAYFGFAGVSGAWCKDSNGYTTKWKNGKC